MYYASFSYKNAIKKYEAVKDKDIDINRKLATAYFKIDDYKKSEEYRAKVATDPQHSDMDLYDYASILAINEKYEESEEWMNKFYQTNKHDRRAQMQQEQAGFYKVLQVDKGIFIVENLPINSDQQDFGTSYFKKDIVFSSSRPDLKKMMKKKWNWNKLPYLDIYIGKTDSTGNITALRKFKGKYFNKRLHEGPVAFNKAGDYMIFTRNNYKGKSKSGIVKLQMFSSTLKDGKWQKPKALKFNSSEYSVGHAALNAQGDTMYFTSDMPGGFGGTDLYITSKDKDGNWKTPVNLGKTINTEGNEMFPFIHPNGMLLFASNGHVGLGGLDIFLSRKKDGSFTPPENLGVPINSSHDDFALIIDDKEKTGYFSSNRPEGKGNDDIYFVKFIKPLQKKKYLKGKTWDNDSNLLADTKVYLLNEQKDTIAQTITGENGEFTFEIDPNNLYTLTGKKDTYTETLRTIDSRAEGQTLYADLLLNKSGKEISENVVSEDAISEGAISENAKYTLRIIVSDAETRQALKDANVNLKGLNEETNLKTSDEGVAVKDISFLSLNDIIEPEITVRKENYMTTIKKGKWIIDHQGEYSIHVMMDKKISISPIYFDFDKSNIRKDASKDLDKVIALMNKYPFVEIELSSHTDCRGSRQYNQKLSERRAKSSLKYIRNEVKENPQRIYGKGYGEDRLVNDCACEGTKRCKCSNEEHQLNRRTEFLIIKY